LIFLVIFCDYALALWYGSVLIWDSTFGISTWQGTYNIGTVITVFFSILIGGFAISQLTPQM